jgi:AcrR family transcriptional regulator
LAQARRSTLRADAARNVAQIRAAALAAFRGRGLATPLEEVATAAGVSKATIYNRFGGRDGLVDAVIEELVAADIRQAIARAEAIEDPWARIASYTRDHRDLLYREPAAVDAILMDYPDSPRFVELCHTAADAADRFIRDGHRAGVVRADFTVDDFNHATVATALSLRHWAKPDRVDYDRRTGFFLDSLRP